MHFAGGSLSTSPTRAQFPTTRWTLIERSQGSPADLEALLAIYWSPIYAFMRRRGHGRDDAADLTQAFCCDVMLRRELLSKADRTRGSFRSFLRASLRNFAIDRYRRIGGDRPARSAPTLDEVMMRAAEPSSNDDPERAFDRQWAVSWLDATCKETEAACLREGLTRQWAAFESRVLTPLMHGSTAPSVESLVAVLGARDAAEVSNMIYSVKRKFETTARRLVEATVDDPSAVDQELADMKGALLG